MAKEEVEKRSYYFTKIWFDFACQNPEKITPTHTAMYLWLVELNNRMQWAEKFASPASQVMQYTGIKSYNTYKKIFDDLVSMNFVSVIMESKNQFTACIIALSKFDKAHNKALDKAISKMPNQKMIEQLQEHSESTEQSTDSIIKQEEIKPIEIKEEYIPVLDLKCDTIYDKIIGYLNLKSGTKYQANSKITKRLIDARIGDKFTVDDFIIVIDKMVNKWQNNEEMCQYIRPETLFGTKFESYLNLIHVIKIDKTDSKALKIVTDSEKFKRDNGWIT